MTIVLLDSLSQQTTTAENNIHAFKSIIALVILTCFQNEAYDVTLMLMKHVNDKGIMRALHTLCYTTHYSQIFDNLGTDALATQKQKIIDDSAKKKEANFIKLE